MILGIYHGLRFTYDVQITANQEIDV